MARKRQLTAFSLSFLDIMCCGFGAVVLVFLIIDHSSETQSKELTHDLMAEINFLEEDVGDGLAGLVRLRNTLSMLNEQWSKADGLAKIISEQKLELISKLTKISNIPADEKNTINQLKMELKKLDKNVSKLRIKNNKNTGLNPRSFIGDGDRQYLTGLKLGGERILILIDSSASMLDSSIVNIVRLRNMSNNIKRNAKKWRRAVATAQWLIAQFPSNGQYQIYTFNKSASAVLPKTQDQWLEVSNKSQLEDTVKAINKIIPENGTNLENVFLSILDMSPLPDNIFLLTDGLPTLGGRSNKAHTVSGKERMALFEQALNQVADTIPFNIVLFPLEGDPMAASAFWQLAQQTQGTFLSPSEDWP